MAAKLVFPLQNNYTQHNEKSEGICTAASLAWCRKCLQRGSAVNSYQEIGINQVALEAQMAVIRKQDGNAQVQTNNAGLSVVSEMAISSLDEVIKKTKSMAPHVCIFWNSFHTMGYRYAHNQKEFFDMNEGLYRAKTSAEIKAKMEEVFRRNQYGAVVGMRIVGLGAI